MDVQTAWIALRGLGVAVVLLTHGSPNQPTPAPHTEDLAVDAAAAFAQHLPHAMSMDQILAAMSR